MGKINDFGFPFTSVTGDRQYSASEWRDYFGKLIKNGVIQNDGNVVAVVQQVSANKTVSVGTGSVFINGVMFINDSAKTLSITDNTSGNSRKDRIVARLNYTDRKIEFGVLIGTPAGSPVAPTLTRNTTVYELGIADITLANGFSTIVTANILDTRSDVDLCGASSMTIGVIPASGADAVTIQLSTETATLYSVANVDLAIKKALNLSSYQAFCANANADSLDAAFGKNNEDEIYRIGKQLAMYAWFKGTSVSILFTEILGIDRLNALYADETTFNLLMGNSYIAALIMASPYARELTFPLTNLVGTTFTSVSGTGTITLDNILDANGIGGTCTTTSGGSNFSGTWRTIQSLDITNMQALIFNKINLFKGLFGSTVGQQSFQIVPNIGSAVTVNSANPGDLYEVYSLAALKAGGATSVYLYQTVSSGTADGGASGGRIIGVYGVPL